MVHAKVNEVGTLCLTVLTGSRAYGLERPDSDRDLRHVYCVPTSRLLSIGDGISSTQTITAEQDESGWELKHFLEMCLKCNPNALEVMFAPIVECNSLGLDLRELMPLVISRKAVYDAYRGYAHGQMTKMLAYGDTMQREMFKRQRAAACSYLRVLRFGALLLRDHTLNVRIPEGEHKQFLLGIKASTVSMGQVYDMAQQLEAEITAAYEASTMALEPDTERVNRWLLAVRKEMWQ